jgi:hypothetical protein
MLHSGPRAPIQRRIPGEHRELRIVHLNPKYGKARLVEPTSLGYIHVAAKVDPRRLPFQPNSRKKGALLNELKRVAYELKQLGAVEKVTIFDAIALPPANRLPYIRERADTLHLARFDVVVLIETTSPAAARTVETTPAYQALIETLTSQATDLHVMTARNAKRIGDVDTTRKGVFLFNYFVGDDPDVALELWDYLAGWYTVETGIDNSTLLVPVEGERSDYLAINNARWDGSLLGVFLRQATKRSFWTYVQANLEANHVGAMPILYRVVNPAPQAVSVRPSRPSWRLLAGAMTLGAAALLGTALALRRRRHA